MLTPNIQHDEALTDLKINHYQVLQKKQGFRFSIDAILLAHFVSLKANYKVIDLGTGTAVIPLVLTARMPSLTIHGLEIQQDIADMASRSIVYNQLDNIHIIHHDLKTLPSSFNHCYDLVVTNPPYFPVHIGKISPDPHVALSRHELACTLEDIIMHGARFLKSNGHLALIHRAQRIDQIMSLCLAHGLAPKRMRMVHPTIDKPANLVLFEAQKGAKSQLTIEAPLAIYQSDGHYTQEINQYYGGSLND